MTATRRTRKPATGRNATAADAQAAIVANRKPATRRTRPAAQPVKAEVEIPKTRTAEGYVVDLTDPGEDTGRSFEKLLAKPANATHLEFQAWFEAKTGISLDLDTIQYTLATYQDFQRSPEHRKVTQQKREAAATAKAQREMAKVQRAKNLAEKAGLKIAE